MEKEKPTLKFFLMLEHFQFLLIVCSGWLFGFPFLFCRGLGFFGLDKRATLKLHFQVACLKVSDEIWMRQSDFRPRTSAPSSPLSIKYSSPTPAQVPQNICFKLIYPHEAFTNKAYISFLEMSA